MQEENEVEIVKIINNIDREEDDIEFVKLVNNKNCKGNQNDENAKISRWPIEYQANGKIVHNKVAVLARDERWWRVLYTLGMKYNKYWTGVENVSHVVSQRIEYDVLSHEYLPVFEYECFPVENVYICTSLELSVARESQTRINELTVTIENPLHSSRPATARFAKLLEPKNPKFRLRPTDSLIFKFR